MTFSLALLILASSFFLATFTVCDGKTADPTQIRLFLGPNKLPADGKEYTCVFVELLDSSGKPARASSYISISLSSSKTNIGTVHSSIQIDPGQTFGNATFHTTMTAGSTVISASATDFATKQATMTTTVPGDTPSKLVVYIAPPLLPADNKEYQAIQVQAQDSAGHPTPLQNESLSIEMFSSEKTVASIAPLLTIPVGQSSVFGTVKVTNNPGTSVITAQRSGLSTDTTQLTTYQIDLATLSGKITTAQQAILNGNKTDISVSVTVGGTPITRASVTFSSNNGGTFSDVKEQSGGVYKTTFTAPSFSKTTNCTITAVISKTGYVSGQSTMQISVGPTVIGAKTVLQLQIINEVGEPLTKTLITSFDQPNGIGTLTSITNSTGYVVFKDIVAGPYSFKIVKDGYLEFNQTLTVPPQPLTLSITLLRDEIIDAQTLILVAVIVVIAAVVAVSSAMLIIKRRRSERVRKLQQLQKQLKYKDT